jgi:DNA-binding XRE family transcriptional regulator
MNKIKRTREKLGFTQTRMARELGMSQPSMSRLEKEEKIPRKISLALDGLIAKQKKANSNGARKP